MHSKLAEARGREQGRGSLAHSLDRSRLWEQWVLSNCWLAIAGTLAAVASSIDERMSHQTRRERAGVLWCRFPLLDAPHFHF